MNFDLRRGVEVLERTPTVVRDLLSGMPDEWTRTNEGPETFSPFDNLGHLIDGEETDWMVRARIILARGENLRFEPYDRFRHRTINKGKSIGQLLDRFAEPRARNLAELAALNLTPEKLKLPGEHPELGPVTLEQLLAAWVVHDLGHIAQITRVMAKQYREAVGPWHAYLPVLSR